ncbi:MAG: hypothetical protein ACM3O6_12770 [Acidobacteriota bacterium]
MSELAASGASALRLTFPSALPAGAARLATFPELGRVALAAPLPLDALGEAEPDESALQVLHLPGGNAASVGARQAAEAWAVGEGGSIDLVLQSDRILWRPGRALVIGGDADFETYLLGLAHFAAYEGEIRRLEARVGSWLRSAEEDIALTHEVGGEAVRRWPHVNAMTFAVTQARMTHVAIEGPLEHGPAELPGLARRLFTELALRAEAAHRLKRVDEKIDVLSDLYELANDRLSEYSYFRREYVLEALIIAVLVLEAALLIYDIF